MPKRIHPLTDIQVKTTKPSQKSYKLSDGGGMYLLVTPSGGKLWRFDYRYASKRKTMTFGEYPDVSLSKARDKRGVARQQLADGVDPGEAKKIKKLEQEALQANTFKKLSEDWYERQTDSLAETAKKVLKSRLKNDILPAIGNTPLVDLKPTIILQKVLRPIEDRGSIETAHRVRGLISQVLRYGVGCGACERDLTVDLRGALKPVPRGHHAAFDADGTTDPAKVGALLRAIDSFDGSMVVKGALQLHPYVATRPGELRHAEWSEIDLESATWSIPAGKMKMKTPHIIPLSSQAINILSDLQKHTGSGRYVFPSVRSMARPISDNTMNAGLRRLGYTKDEIVSHGWRAIFRTLADEVLQERIDFIEAQLAHQVSDALGRAYNRTSFLKERRELMDRWGQYLDGLKAGAKVIPLRANQ